MLNGAKHRMLVGNKKEKNPLTRICGNNCGWEGSLLTLLRRVPWNDGQNTGVPFADSMSPPVPSLASAEVQSYTDGQLKWVIDYGIWPSGMPGSKGTLSDEEIWSIVIFLRHLPPAGSLGEPEMYSH